MIVRLALSLVLVLIGGGVPLGSGAADGSLTDGIVGGSVTAADGETGTVTLDALEAAAARAEASEVSQDAVAESPEVTTVDLVVPGVDDAGAVDLGDEQTTESDDLVADEVAGDRVVTEVLETDGFQTVGVTWPTEVDAAAGDIAPQVRTRAADGTWSAWEELEPADDAPDAGTADAENAARGGTDPLWVGEAEAIQVSFDADADAGPDGLSLTLVDVPDAEIGTETDAGLTATQASWSTETGGLSVVPAVATVQVASSSTGPKVITRSEWGAASQACTPDTASALVGAVVHHTAGSNSYSSVAEAMKQIRGDQAYHISGRGWCDIGYNFLVDKWGNIYEGRANSLTKAIIGVHAGGFNTGTLGISMLGTYDAQPSTATQRAVAQIIGWRFGSYGIDPESTMKYYTYGGQNSKVPAGTTKTLPRIFGHRDVAYTACPGDGGYAALAAIRKMAGSYSYDQKFDEATSVVKALYADLLGRGVDPTGLATWTSRLVGGTSQSALVAELTRSDEYIALRVTKAYREVLGREPESVGAANWLTQIRARRATVDDVQRRFFDSQEFVNKSGGTPEGYVAAMYRAMLGREATTAEIASSLALMADEGRSVMVDSLWFSEEAAGVRAGAYYSVFLKRDAEGAGKANWTTVLLEQDEGAVRTGIAGSQEYRAKALIRYP